MHESAILPGQRQVVEMVVLQHPRWGSKIWKGGGEGLLPCAIFGLCKFCTGVRHY